MPRVAPPSRLNLHVSTLELTLVAYRAHIPSTIAHPGFQGSGYQSQVSWIASSAMSSNTFAETKLLGKRK